MMAFRFGTIINDAPTIQVSLIGTALNIAYICFFFCYTNNVKDKMLAWSQIGYGGAFVAAIFAYTLVESPKELPFRFGIIFTAVLFFFVGMPFLSLVSLTFLSFLLYCVCLNGFSSNVYLQGEIIRNKSTEGLPFPIILSGTAISFLWFLYGVATREQFTIIQNGVMFLMSVIQLSLFAIYPSTPAKSKKEASPSKINNNNKKLN